VLPQQFLTLILVEIQAPDSQRSPPRRCELYRGSTSVLWLYCLLSWVWERP
jgi:hypothetical protein